MEARHQLRRFPARAFLVGMALFVLALLSAVGGYSLRMLTATTGTTVIRVYQPATNATIQPGPNPDTLDHGAGARVNAPSHALNGDSHSGYGAGATVSAPSHALNGDSASGYGAGTAGGAVSHALNGDSLSGY